ncbi:GntR family transcriptional regulator [Pseudarthrobacter sp. alpha12b]
MANGVEGISPPKSRTAYVAARLKEDVANGVIQPGELIKQTVLAKRYGVSATPVREALRLLESDGVITYSQHKGASVRELTPDTARDLYRIRAAAEAVAAQMAVERMTPEGLDRIRAKNNALRAAVADPEVTPAELSQMNREFHFAIYEMSSPLVLQYIELLWSRFTPGATVWRRPKDATELQHEHEQILDAIERGDGEAAGAFTAAHIAHAAAVREHDPNLRASGTEEQQNFQSRLV